MRSLALLLLLLNISFLTWQLSLLPWLPWQPSQLTVARPHPSSAFELPQLILLSERDLLNNTGVFNQTIEEQTTPPATDIPTVAAMVNPLSEADHEADILGAETHKTSTDLPLATPANLQPAAGLAMVNEKKSVDEEKANTETAPDTSTPPKVLSVAKKTPSSKPPTKRLACFQAGPYTKIGTAQKIVNGLKIKKEDIIANIQRRETQVLASTWIYSPPFANRQAAIRAQQHLNRLGIKDHEIVKKRPFNNAISLGLYRQPSSVKRRLKELSAKSYKNIKTQKRYKSDTKYWLNVKMPHQNDLLNAFRKKFLRHKLVKVACK
ncbi:MAG: hypothetical protein DRR19_14655 [Candidatus Parabeggiatoa sp. nov. 1]|nr:MAG: hypothetical protein DRR19_14655 [Gammaproteobacteria bacterium]